MPSSPPDYEEIEKPPPSYVAESLSSIASDGQKLAEKGPREMKIRVALYDTHIKLKMIGSKAVWQPFGHLQIGLKRPWGVLHNHVAYRPPFNPDDLENDTQWDDISSSTEVLDDRPDKSETHYVKAVEPIKAPYAFDIVFSSPGSTANFKGTFTDEDNQQWEWKGRCIMPSMDTTIYVHPKPDITAPKDLKGSLGDLIEISPFAWQNGDGFQAGDDVAQVRGDEMWQKIAFHSLPPSIKTRLFRDLHPLTGPERDLLDKYPEFFKRFAVHEMAERLKKTQQMPADIKDHIQYKKYWFLQMMTSYAPPKKGSGQPDPVVQYGWDREKNKKELVNLQKQYMGVAMDCYETGYISFRSEWTQFLEQPDYWFQIYARYLESDEHMGPWLAKLLLPARREDTHTMPVSVEVMHWGNKLSLLKHAVARIDPGRARELDVEKTTETLTTAASLHYAYAQMLNDNLVVQMREILQTLNRDSGQHVDEVDRMTEAQKELYIEMKMHGIELFEKLFSDESPLRHVMEKMFGARMPRPG